MIKHIKKHIEGISPENRNLIIGIVVAVIVIAAIGFFVPMNLSGNLSPEKASSKVTDYVTNELLGGQATLKVTEVTSATNELYKVKMTINDKPLEAYMTKDGKLFFPQAFNMGSTTASSSTVAQPTTITKNDKPKVELFVMSYCPYGTQIEKGILPTVEALGNKIDFSLKFVDYAMHGPKELEENLRQYCIDKEQNDKLFSYLTCFLKNDNSASCLTSTGVNKEKLTACTQSADKEFKVTAQLASKENWKGDFPPFDVHKADNLKYDVKGSPTLVINGVKTDSARDSASLLKTICGAFSTEPEICSTANLSTANPGPGFGDASTPGTPAAACATN